MAQGEGYKEAKVAEAKGEAARFESILVEYQRAPEVTRAGTVHLGGTMEEMVAARAAEDALAVPEAEVPQH